MGEHTGEIDAAQRHYLAGGDVIDEALAELGREARADEACSICHASVRPDRRDRHLDWHASLTRDVERERLPQVYGEPRTPPGQSAAGKADQ